MPIQNTKPADYPQAVITQIELLAQNIVIARKRRKETQAQWAKKLGVSQPTMARIERGDPAVAMASYVMCMWLINPASALADLVSPQSDHISLERDIAKLRARGEPVRPSSPNKRGGSSATEMARISGVGAAADVARLTGASSAVDMARISGGSMAAEIAKNLGASSVQTAAGLAALIAKAQGNAQ